LPHATAGSILAVDRRDAIPGFVRHILCPHCRNPIELVALTPRAEVACPSCGSTFCLETGTTASTFHAHEKLDRFELLCTLGQGAFGTVFKARDPKLDRVVALKVPRAGNLSGPQELDRYLREARSAAQLQHPSIVAVHEVGQVEGVPFLVSTARPVIPPEACRPPGVHRPLRGAHDHVPPALRPGSRGSRLSAGQRRWAFC
jgi:ribosomal protein S27E